MTFRFELAGSEVDLPRNIALLDTNFVVALLNVSDQHHEQAKEFADAEFDYVWLLTQPVLVESAGLLSKRRDRSHALRVISWYVQPSSNRHIVCVNLLSDEALAYSTTSNLMNRFGIDYVDAFLIEVADKISEAGEISSGVPIITFDTPDYTRCIGSGFRYSIFDMNDISHQQFL